jgi:cellobiose phosphorylase
MLKTLGIPDVDLPPIRFLSNGRYTVMLHGRGGGWSRWSGVALNDRTWNGREERGTLKIYVRDLDDGSLAVFGMAHRYDLHAIPSGDQWVSVVERVAAFELHMRVHVAATRDCEVRELCLRNLEGRARRVEVTVYLPLALNGPAAQRSHPAFSKLFVQTEWLPAEGALLARRRPRGHGDPAPCCIARLLGPGDLRWETDRAKFLGRGRGEQQPQGVFEGLQAGQKNVLDPAFVLQRGVVLVPRGEATLTLILGAAADREAALDLVRQPLSALTPLTRETDMLAEALAGAMQYAVEAIAAPAAERECAEGHPGAVWPYGMPTDRPFALIEATEAAQIDAASDLQLYWRSLALDVPILMLLRDSATTPDLVAAAAAHTNEAGLVIRTADAVSAADRAALRAVAALVNREPDPVVEFGESASTAESVHQQVGVIIPDSTAVSPAATTPETLCFDNGTGGFTADGREYVIRLPWVGNHLRLPPLPWINVLANPHFGALVSETGAGCTWSANSHQHRLTPWANDPVLDPHQETLILQDATTGIRWSPLPGPLPAHTGYEVRHGFGQTVFHHASHGLHQQTTVFVHESLPVKIYRLELSETEGVTRHLRLNAAQHLVLGFLPEETRPYVSVQVDAARQLLCARNRMAGDFAAYRTFATVVSAGDLREFTWHGLEGKSFEQMLTFTLPAGARASISILFGDVASESALEDLLKTLNTDAAILAAQAEVLAFWEATLTAVQVETPSPAINFMLNGWLLYQTLACRMWGRMALYQSSGAYGFRDQLQDSGALIHARPDLTRRQILLHASRQFVEGDVQHWWHEPPLDRGLRTRFADDLNWLPLLTAFYVKSTGDRAVLDEILPFLAARVLQEGEDEAYLQAVHSAESGTLYEHCCRALDRSLTRGQHGLPLMGTGDWNDGMNRVGREGRGESVWMGFFLYTVIEDFLPLCEARQDGARATRYRDYREHLRGALNADGWDGEWYRRAWYDNGEPLGSAASDECRIDALAQAWAVLSGAAPADRAEQAMQALEEQLIDREGGLIRLLTPPFADTPNDPGYIKGYVAGVRENGGQYTHGAAWVVRAMAVLSRHESVAELFEMLLPVSHTDTPVGVERYKTEPYVAVADVYGTTPHVGRGGWTWYTGSAGWLYRVGLESLLGLSLQQGDTLLLKPCIPAAWPGFRLRYRTPAGGDLLIEVESAAAAKSVTLELDGRVIPVTEDLPAIPLAQLAGHHLARIRMPRIQD